MSDPQTMVKEIEAALAENAGAVEVVIDGTRVKYDRDQALRELGHWKRRAAQREGRKPRISSLDLGSAF